MKKIMLMLLAFVLMSCSTTDTDTGSGTNPNPIVPLPNELTGTWELSEGELTAIDGTTGTTLDSFFIFKDDKTLTIKGNTGTVLATAKIESSENLSLALGSDPATEVGVAFVKFDATSVTHADKYIAFVATDWNLYMSRIGDSIADVKANLLLTDATKGGAIKAFGNSSVSAEPTFIASSATLVAQLQGDWGLSRTALKSVADDSVVVASYSFYNIASKAVTVKDNKTGAVIGAATIEDTVSKMRVNQTVIDVYTLTVGADKVVFYMDGESILVSPVGTIEAIKAEVSRKELTVLLQGSDKLASAPTFKDFTTVYAPFKSSTTVNTWVGERPFVNALGQSADTTIPRAIFVDDITVTLGGTLVSGDIEKALSPEKLRVTLDGATSSTWVDVIWSKFTVGLNGKYVGYFIEGGKLYSTIVGTQEEIRADLVVADKKVKVLSLEMTEPKPLEVLKLALVGEWATSITPINNWKDEEIIPTAATYTFDADGVATITDSSGATLMTATPVAGADNPVFPAGMPPASWHSVINATNPSLGGDFTEAFIALQSKNGALLLELTDSNRAVVGYVGAMAVDGKFYITKVATGVNQFKSEWGSSIATHGNSVYGVVVSKTP